jgi:hypothetical protein
MNAIRLAAIQADVSMSDAIEIASDLKQAKPTLTRTCALCKRPRTKSGHDPCIEDLPGVLQACCGHGVTDGYFVLADTDETFYRCNFSPKAPSTLTFEFEDGSTTEIACEVLSKEPLADAVDAWRQKYRLKQRSRRFLMGNSPSRDPKKF